MDNSICLALTENLLALEQTATSCREDILKKKLKASRYHSISLFFSTHTKDFAHPDKWAEVLVAKEFKDRADMEEGFVASGLQRLANVDSLRQRMLVLLDEWNKRCPSREAAKEYSPGRELWEVSQRRRI